jgi:predicted amino acid racemase
MYPRLEIDLEKLDENARVLLNLCHGHGIDSVFLVTKVLAGYLPGVQRLAGAGFSHLADSRMENLIRFKNIPLPKVLLRLPMQSEAKRVVKYADISLNSEISTIAKLNEAALKQKKIHGVILMIDLGDLREGLFFQDDYLPLVGKILAMPGIDLEGIGTNLTCFGGVIPDEKNLSILVGIQETIDQKFDRNLKILSGGNSSSLHLLSEGRLPEGINSLRVGEALFLGRETAFGTMIPGMQRDIFTLKAEIIEAKTKPSFPIGNIGMNAFGDHPHIEDQGLMRRGILAIGRQDADPSDLQPRDSRVKIIGGSSDHLIVNLSETTHKTGNILEFDVNYGGLLRLMTSPYVKKTRRR